MSTQEKFQNYTSYSRGRRLHSFSSLYWSDARIRDREISPGRGFGLCGWYLSSLTQDLPQVVKTWAFIKINSECWPRELLLSLQYYANKRRRINRCEQQTQKSESSIRRGESLWRSSCFSFRTNNRWVTPLSLHKQCFEPKLRKCCEAERIFSVV